LTGAGGGVRLWAIRMELLSLVSFIISSVKVYKDEAQKIRP